MKPPDPPASFLLLGFHRQCEMVRILSAKPTELAFISPLGFNHMIKPYSNEPVALRVEGAEEGRDAAFSVLLHITDADRIIDLELMAPKRLSNVIFLSWFFLFFFFPPLRCDVFNRPLR